MVGETLPNLNYAIPFLALEGRRSNQRRRYPSAGRHHLSCQVARDTFKDAIGNEFTAQDLASFYWMVLKKTKRLVGDSAFLALRQGVVVEAQWGRGIIDASLGYGVAPYRVERIH